MALISTPGADGGTEDQPRASKDLYLEDEMGITRLVAAGDIIPANLRKPDAKARKAPAEDKSRRSSQGK